MKHTTVLFSTALFIAAAPALHAQGGRGGPQAAAMRQASQLDLAGRTTEARAIFQRMIDSAADPAAKAAAQRAMAMSYAFDGNCAKTLEHEQLVIGFWKTREAAEPQNAFYQEGEMANEGARVCIDAGGLDSADKWYRLGTELGNREPEPRTHPKSLWDFRLAHALGRLAARRGDMAEAKRQIVLARRALDSDSVMASQQERFFPYLTGYVALYAGDPTDAERDLSRAVSLRGNERDPFMLTLLGMAYEKLGREEDARATYQKAYDLATAHNPPAAFARPFTRRKLGVEPNSY